MCSVSMIMDHTQNIWQQRHGQVLLQHQIGQTMQPMITQNELEEFRQLLERAREYDRKNNQANCEIEEKKEKVRNLAKELGVKIDFL